MCLLVASLLIFASCNFQDKSREFTTLATAEGMPSSTDEKLNDECIQSFQDFAYTIPEWNRDESTQNILPLSPWQIEALLPQLPENESLQNADISAIRSLNGQIEIWIHVSKVVTRVLPPLPTVQSEAIEEFWVYQPQSKQWRVIPANLEDTDIFVTNLFVKNDGTLWGQNVRKAKAGDYSEKNIPLLSVFDEQSQQFEYANGVVEIPHMQDENLFQWPYIFLDASEEFLIFVGDDGIYQYNTDDHASEKLADLTSLTIRDATDAPDGSIYFYNYVYSNFLVDGMLYQFFPENGSIVPVEMPDESWPIFSGLLVDQNSNLWLGSIGYRGSDGAWHLIYPNLDAYLEHQGEYFWSPVKLFMESSDGRLWFQKWLDTNIIFEGMAWYDPQTGEGCMFTNQVSNIMEDANHNLWLVAAGKLFKYSLQP